MRILALMMLMVVGCGEVENGAYKHRPKPADKNESTQTTNTNEVDGTTAKPVKKLTLREEVAGEYDYKEGSPAYRFFFLENGILERYRSGEKRNDAKWSIVKGEIHVVHDFGEIHVFGINKDKSITEIALIKDKKRSDWPYEKVTLKKIK